VRCFSTSVHLDLISKQASFLVFFFFFYKIVIIPERHWSTLLCPLCPKAFGLSLELHMIGMLQQQASSISFCSAFLPALASHVWDLLHTNFVIPRTSYFILCIQAYFTYLTLPTVPVPFVPQPDPVSLQLNRCTQFSNSL